MRKYILLTGAVLAGLSAPAAFAQTFPSGPIEIVVPFSTGSNDVEARYFAHELSVVIGQPVVVQNRPGAAGTVGADYVARSAPDGHTLIMTLSPPMTYAQHVFPDLTYSIPDDFAPVAGMLQTVSVMVKNPGFAPETVEEVIAYAKENPNKIRFGSPGVGSGGHILVEAMNHFAEVEIQHVPYAGGAPVIQDLLAGRIELAEVTMSTVRAYLDSGDLEIVALLEAEPSEVYPQYSILEDTLPGVARAKWYGLLAPAGTPDAVLDVLQNAVEEVITRDYYIENVGTRGEIVHFLDREEFAALIEDDVAAYTRLFEETGITFQ